jgi:hypothetical protein
MSALETSLERKRLERGLFSCTKIVQKLSSHYAHENKIVASEYTPLETLESPLYMQSFPCSSMNAAGKLHGLELSSLQMGIANKRVRTHWLSSLLSSPAKGFLTPCARGNAAGRGKKGYG